MAAPPGVTLGERRRLSKAEDAIGGGGNGEAKESRQ